MSRKKVIEIVLDIETTGLDYKRERMVEFAAIRLENGVIKDSFETLINPQQHIRKSSIAIHGITEEMVKEAPKEEEIIDKILDFISDYPIVAHNVIFDYSFINEASLRHKGKPIENQRIDTQYLFREVFPDEDSPNLDNVASRFNIQVENRHRAMGDTKVLAYVYPKLKKLFDKKYDWQLKQLKNVPYLFERYLRISQSISVLQSELLDLKSIFKLYFEKNGEPIEASTGELLTYHSKQSFAYDLSMIKDSLEELGALNKALKVNNGFVDRLVSSLGQNEELQDKFINARLDFSETRNVQIIKPSKNN